jgi:hypothetical protein
MVSNFSVQGYDSFKIHFMHYANIWTGGTNKNHDKVLVNVAGLREKIWTQNFQNT